MYKISADKPILLNFDGVFREMELSIIMKMDQGEQDPQSISNSILAYSKS